jgi:hypothetical protein
MIMIGTSFGRCMTSILKGEVREQDVLFIVTGTMCSDKKEFLVVAETYFNNGNRNVFNNVFKPEHYNVKGFTREEYMSLANHLYDAGKIHQPRNFAYGHGLGRSYQSAWLQVVPTNENTTPAVVDAWEKYVMLDNLTK